MKYRNTSDLQSVRRSAKKAIAGMIHDRMTSDGRSYAFESLPRAARYARETAAINALWDRLERVGLVRFRLEPETILSFDDLTGDVYDVEMHKDTVPGGARTIIAQEKAERRRIDAEGVWGICADYRTSPDGVWEAGRSVWGFVGDDWRGSGYDEDVRAEAIGALKEALSQRCPCCRK